MKLSQTGLELIKSFEGLRLKAYKAVPTEKYYTIGYGHYGADVKSDDKISEKKAEELLKKDIEKFEKGVESAVKVPINQHQFDALVSFAYNVGSTALKDSTLLQFVNKKDFENASGQFPRWNKSGGNVLAGLTRRRKSEQLLFNTPIKKATDTKTKNYSIKLGDTLSQLAIKNQTEVNKLLKLNPTIKDANRLFVGQKIKLPK